MKLLKVMKVNKSLVSTMLLEDVVYVAIEVVEGWDFAPVLKRQEFTNRD